MRARPPVLPPAHHLFVALKSSNPSSPLPPSSFSPFQVRPAVSHKVPQSVSSPEPVNVPAYTTGSSLSLCPLGTAAAALLLAKVNRQPPPPPCYIESRQGITIVGSSSSFSVLLTLPLPLLPSYLPAIASLSFVADEQGIRKGGGKKRKKRGEK